MGSLLVLLCAEPELLSSFVLRWEIIRIIMDIYACMFVLMQMTMLLTDKDVGYESCTYLLMIIRAPSRRT